MRIHPLLANKLKALVIICFVSALAGVVFQFFDEGRVGYESVLVGIPMGLFFGLFELFIFHGKFRRLPFVRVLLIKTTLYTALILVIHKIIGLIHGYYIQGKQIEEWYASLGSREQLSLLLYVLTLYAILIFFLQINRLLGQGVLWKFIRGKYHQPIEELRIFMFLDVKSSTTIAEQMGGKQYYSWLNEFFHLFTEPVAVTKAEIYQYVGDEVVFSWEALKGFSEANCLQIFFRIKQKVEKHRKFFEENYGIIPEFKAGIHFGKVISAQIGDIKREIIYNGDVLNTASRIQEQCNVMGKELLVSGDLLQHVELDNHFISEKMGSVQLRGKQIEVDIYSISITQEHHRG